MGRLRGEGGYSLVELLTVMVILSVVLGGLTTLFVQGSNGEVDLNRRFQAQEGARLALDRLRREVHCASSISPTQKPAVAVSSITETLPGGCVAGGGAVTWCVLTNPKGPATRLTLYRQLNGACSTSSQPWADYLTVQNIFTNNVQSTSTLGSLHVALELNVMPSKSYETFRLTDDVVLRNSTRTCITNSPAPCP